MIKKELGIDAVLEAGDLGQFDVLADGDLVATRSKKILDRLLNGGMPSEVDVVAALRGRE